MMSRLNGGGEEKMDPGFDVISKKVAPNVLAWEPSPGNMAQMLQTAEAELVAWRKWPRAVGGRPRSPSWVRLSEGRCRGLDDRCLRGGRRTVSQAGTATAAIHRIC